VHSRRLPRVSDPGPYPEHDLVFFVGPVRLVRIFSNILRVQQLQHPQTLLPLNSPLDDDSVHAVLNVKDNTRIAGQVSSLLRTGISLEIETVLLPDAPDRNRMLLPLPALGGYPVHLLPQQFLASVLPGNPSLRLVRNLPLGRQPRSNSTRHKPSPNNEEEIRSLRPEDRMRTYPLEIPRDRTALLEIRRIVTRSPAAW